MSTGESFDEEDVPQTPRKTAGFEWAAEPDEMLFPCCATKFVMIGIAAFLCVVAIVGWIVSSYWTDFVFLVIATLFMGLIILLPEYFCNIVNFAINFCVWVAFVIFCFVYGIKHLVDRGNVEWHQSEIIRKQHTDAAIFDFIEGTIALLVVILMFRMLYWFYINRDGGGGVAVAA